MIRSVIWLRNENTVISLVKKGVSKQDNHISVVVKVSIYLLFHIFTFQNKLTRSLGKEIKLFVSAIVLSISKEINVFDTL